MAPPRYPRARSPRQARAIPVAIPAGALSADTTISVVEITSPALGSIGKTYDIGPSGTQFKTPVTLSFNFAEVDLKGALASDLEVATIVNSEWAPLVGDTVDTVARVASGTTMHLSPYTLIAAEHPVDPPADGGSDAAGGDSGSDGGDAGPQCAAEAVGIGSCMNHPTFCQSLPGTHAAGCTTNDGGIGYVVTCCPNDAGS